MTTTTEYTRRTPTTRDAPSRNPETTTKNMARHKYQEQKLVSRRPCFTIQ